MNLQVLALLLRTDRGQRSVMALPVIAFGVVTTLVLTVVGGAQSFWSGTGAMAPVYQALAAIALVLLLVPLMSLGGAAARLSARRRDERLSTLRLLGVSPAGVTAATVIESVLLAGAGAVIGVLGFLAISPLIAMIPFRGQALGLTGVLLPPHLIAAVVLGVLLVAAMSAVLGLRRVVISPLGVRMRASATPVHWIRAVIAVGVLAVAYALISVFPSVAGFVATIVVLSALFAAALGVLNLVGPWVLRITAAAQLRRAERPERLLAARMVLDSPKTSWRQISGVAMSSFIAVFAGTGVALMNVMGGDGDQAVLAADMRTGLIITLAGSFLMVAASVGVNQASEVLDQQELHRSLHRLGTPLETVDRARRRAVMSPLLITALGSAVIGAVLVFPLLGLALITAPASLLTISLVVAVGIGVVWLATRATRPMLARAFASV